MSECPVPARQGSDRERQREREPGDPLADPQTTRPRTNRDWWPNQLDLSVLHTHSPRSNPMGEDFDYAEEFETLDVEALKRDIMELMTTSQDWWPADYGHYGGLFIRMSWHSAGTYRIADGRGGGGQGAQRFAPLNSWPDNVSLDKARRLLWPVKKKYGSKISWADLIIFAGNCAYESMGLETFGFGFGREDIYEPEEIFWGPEDTWLGDERFSGDRELHGELGASQLGLIYVNPEGPNGQPSALAAARDIRDDVRPHGDERRGDRRADHRRPHGRQGPRRGPRRPPRSGPRGRAAGGAGAGLEEPLRHRQGRRHDHQRPRGRLDRPSPTKWDNGYLDNLFRYDWDLTKSPAGAWQWVPTDPRRQGHGARRRTTRRSGARPIMFTTDLAMKLDPIYGPIAKRSTTTRKYFSRRSPRPGTSCCTATWGPSRATSARGCRSRSCGRTPSPRSTTS